MVDHRTGRPVEELRVILRHGRPDQEVVPARRLYRSKDLDLAIIFVDSAKRDSEVVSLGADGDLEELADVVAFGASSSRDQASSVIGPVFGSVSALLRNGQTLERIQFDAPIGPGATGGPLLDTRGRVIGVVTGRARADFGAGVALAVPVGTLRRYLYCPVIEFIPPVVEPERADQPVTFDAWVSSLLPEKEPLEVELDLETAPPLRRRFRMARLGEFYRVNAPLLTHAYDSTVRFNARFPDGHVRGWVRDCSLQVGERTIRLSQVCRISQSPAPRVNLRNREVLDGPITWAGLVDAKLGEQRIPLDLSAARWITVDAPREFPAVPCAIVVTREGKEVARLERLIHLGGGGGFEALKAGLFLSPRRSETATTYFSVIVSPGTYIGEGRSQFTREGIKVQLLGVEQHLVNGHVLLRRDLSRGVRIDVGGTADSSHWSVRCEAPRGQALRQCHYPNAVRIDANGERPELDVQSPNWRPSQHSGQFRVWELETAENRVTRLAIDFVQYADLNGAPASPVYGMIRYASSFQ
jgi:hypothetical protein